MVRHSTFSRDRVANGQLRPLADRLSPRAMDLREQRMNRRKFSPLPKQQPIDCSRKLTRAEVLGRAAAPRRGFLRFMRGA